MDDRFLGTTAVCFVFNFCLLCSHKLPVSEMNLPVPRPFFKYISKIFFEGQNQNLQKKSCRFTTWMEFVRQILMKLKTSSNEGFLMKVLSHSLMWLTKHCSGHYVTTQACTLISWGCVHLRWCGSLEDYMLCMLHQVCNTIFHRAIASAFNDTDVTEHVQAAIKSSAKISKLISLWWYFIIESKSSSR